MGQLEGKVAIVTGANKGIGKQIAIRYAEEGAKVVLASRIRKQEEHYPYPLEAVRDTIRESGGTAVAVHCDLLSRDDIVRTVETAVREFGRVDILVNNGQAGIAHSGDGLDEFDDRTALELYLGGPVAACHFIRACAPYMKERHYGRIINFSSAAMYGAEGHTAYAMAKAAVVALTRSAAHDLGRYGITVNTVVPIVYTGESLSPHAEAHNRAREEMTKHMPSRYMGKPYDDVAPTCVFLASEGAGYLMGQTINLDGGMNMLT